MLQIILNKLNNNKNKSILKKFHVIKDEVNSLESSFQNLDNTSLSQKTIEFKTRLANGENINNLIAPAFATVREASKRIIKKRHFDVQIIGGLALHNGMIAEMLTGEGKTLVATLSAYLNALEGKGVHIITVNDYLAKRDSEWMGAIFQFLNLSVGCIVSGISDDERKLAYKADITYGTNNEFGFDYLKDNMKLSIEEQVQRGFHYAIVDEVDSVLVDEARTPLIISGPSVENTKLYQIINNIAKFLKKEDFDIDEKQKNVYITDHGLISFENLLKQSGLSISGSLFDAQNLSLYHLLNQSLRAQNLYKKDVDYIIKDGEIVIIDEFTGRMMDGRRFSEGLHQALEAKEGVKVKNENQTLASITLQNYFKMYNKLSGMTGTASTESTEFLEIYGLRVLKIPSNKPVTRKDLNDLIYRSYKEKEKAIVRQIEAFYKEKRPVLIGTVSIEKSEKLSSALKQVKIPHNVLNAKNHEKEAYIVANAGTLAAVTIATNMAGRGTDIQLGGNLDMLIKHEVEKLNNDQEKINKVVESLTNKVEKEKEIITALGGLAIIATERHESRRIDNQLRGRSGRQGEPGSSVFYISLEDDLMRIFGGNKLDKVLHRLGFKEDEVITHSFISRAIEKAQKKVEEYNFQIRKNLLRFDSIINEQRTLIYEQRKEVMQGIFNITITLEEDIEEITNTLVSTYLIEKEFREKWKLETLYADLSRLFNINLDLKDLVLEQNLSIEEISSIIKKSANQVIEKKEGLIGKESFSDIAHKILLQNIDLAWKKHLAELDYLRGSINLRAYGQKDPFNEYQMESFNLFEDMLSSIKEDFITVISHLDIVEKEQEENKEKASPFFNSISRNESCPCGSGKKYKHCHGKI